MGNWGWLSPREPLRRHAPLWPRGPAGAGPQPLCERSGREVVAAKRGSQMAFCWCSVLMILAWTPARGPLVREGGGHRPWCESWLTVTLGTSSFLSLSFPVCKVVDVRDCFGKFCKDLEIRYAKHQQSASVSGTPCVPGAVSDHSPGVCRAPGNHPTS